MSEKRRTMKVCCVCGLIQESKATTQIFFNFPRVTLKHNALEKAIVEERIDAWKKAVPINFGRRKQPTVCSDHFKSGKPAYLYLKDDVDWIPTINMGINHLFEKGDDDSDATSSLLVAVEDSQNCVDIEGNNSDLNESHMSAENVEESIFVEEQVMCNLSSSSISMDNNNPTSSFLQETTERATCSVADCLPTSKKDSSSQTETTERATCSVADCLPTSKKDSSSQTETTERATCSVADCLPTSKKDSSTQTDEDTVEKILYSRLNDVTFQLDNLKQEQARLARQVNDLKMINRIRGDDKWTRFYTGLHCWNLFMIILKLCTPAILHITVLNKNSLPLEEQLLLTLMRLRLNLTEQDLAFRFGISQSYVSNIFCKWIDIMYVRLARNFMVWPEREELRTSMPTFFRKRFPSCVAIIDCFEVPLERFLNLLARASTFSFYKGRNTIKFLIAVSPTGAITYISQAYGGRSSDIHISLDSKNKVVFEDKNFLSKLVTGDVVLADRGFLIEQDVRAKGAQLITPSFLGKRSQLTMSETVYSRSVSNVRIHVERVIGALRNFTILTDRVPVNLLRVDEDGLSFIDKIAFVCCCIVNGNPSVVPSS